MLGINETDSNQLKAWKHLQKEISEELNEFLLESQTQRTDGDLPLLTYVLPMEIRSQMHFRLIVVLIKEDLIPKISDFVASSQHFKRIMYSFNCTEYVIVDKTVKKLDDLGSKVMWEEVQFD